MRVVLADLKGIGGLVTKDTVAGGYGSRLVPFSKVSRVVHYLKRRYINLPSVQMAYLAAICDREGHQVAFTRAGLLEGTSPSCCRRSWITATKRRGPTRCARGASVWGS